MVAKKRPTEDLFECRPPFAKKEHQPRMLRTTGHVLNLQCEVQQGNGLVILKVGTSGGS